MVPSAIWFAALLILVVGEAVTVGLTFIWFAIGAAGAMLAALLGGAVWLQVVVFLALSGAALLLVRPAAARLLKTGFSPTNADRVIGRSAVVTEAIDNAAGTGRVSVSGQVWTARSEQNTAIPAGARVRVLRIEGVKVFVEAI